MLLRALACGKWPLMAVAVDPTSPLTLWTLGAFVSGLLPWLITLRQLKSGREHDAARELQLQLDEPLIATKIVKILDKPMSDAIREHNAAQFAHPETLMRYPNLDQFNGAIGSLRGDLARIQSLVEANEKHRSDDMERISGMITVAAEERRTEMRDLKENVARAVGDRARSA